VNDYPLYDSDEELSSIAYFIDENLGSYVPWHLSAFEPDNLMQQQPSTSTQSLLNAYEIAKKQGLYYVYFGNVPFLNETFCPSCDTLSLQRRNEEIFINNISKEACPNCSRPIKGVWN